MLQAVREDPQYKAFGAYGMQLEPWFATFGRNRILLLTFEALSADPASCVNSVLAWLGLDPLPEGTSFGRENALPATFSRSRGQGYLSRLRHSRLWDRLSPLVPKRLRRLGVDLAVAEASASDESRDEVVAELRPWAREVIADLGTLLGRDFPEWTLSLGTDGEHAPRRRGPREQAPVEGGTPS